MSDKPKPGTWGAVTRSAEEESQAFRKSLNNLLLSPERLRAFIATFQIKDKPMSEPQWNIKPRLVRCPRCKMEVMTDKAGPRCEVCGCQMITVIN